MDRELPRNIKLGRIVKRWILGASIILALVLVIWIIRIFGVRSIDWKRVRYSVARISTVETTINASGVIVPEVEQALSAPSNSIVSKTFAHCGDSVVTGQSILELEKNQLQVAYDKAFEELKFTKLKKDGVESELERKKVEMKASEEVKELQAKFAQAQYDMSLALNKIGANSKEEVQRASLAAEIADRELSVVNIQSKNECASLEMQLQTMNLEISIQQNAVNEINRQIKLSKAPSPIDGIVTWMNDSIGATVREGDIIARVADLSSYRLQGKISSINLNLLEVGQRVHVRIGEKIIDGQITSISPLVNNGVSYFYAKLDQASDEILRPNLQVDVFIVTDVVHDVLCVENGPFYTGLHDQNAFVIKGDRATAHKVDIGASNFNDVELQGDISPGDTVIISDMDKYRNVSIIDLKNRD